MDNVTGSQIVKALETMTETVKALTEEIRKTPLLESYDPPK